MATKKILPVVIGGGCLYYYDQNINPIISTNLKKLLPDEDIQPSFTATPPIDVKMNLQSATKDVKDGAKQTFADIKQRAEHESRGISQTIEQQYNKLESKTNELYHKFNHNTDLSTEANNVKQQVKSATTGNDGNWLRSFVAGYIDYVNDIGDALTGTKVEDIKPQTLSSTQKRWFDWGASVSDNAMEKFDFDKAKSINEYESSKQRLTQLTKELQNKSLTPDQQKLLNQAQHDFQNSLTHLSKYGSELVDATNKRLEDIKYSWWTWGSTKKDELSSQYEKQKDLAIKKYKETKNKLDSTSSQTFKSDNDKTDYLKAAERDYNNAVHELSKFGNDLASQINQQLEASKQSWFKWSSKKQDELAQSWDQQKQSANDQYEIAKKKYDEVVDQIKSGVLPEKDQQDHLKQAQNDLNSAWNNLKKIVG